MVIHLLGSQLHYDSGPFLMNICLESLKATADLLF